MNLMHFPWMFQLSLNVLALDQNAILQLHIIHMLQFKVINLV